MILFKITFCINKCKMKAVYRNNKIRVSFKLMTRVFWLGTYVYALYVGLSHT